MAIADPITPTLIADPATATRVQRRAAVSCAELLIVPCLILLQVLLLGDTLPFHRSFWLDEIHTQLLIDDPSLSHATAALAHGVDFNPPTYYLLAKWVSQLGVPAETAQRGFSLICILICCTSVYLLLRDDCRPASATAATLLIWSVNVVQTQAFEARFYAPWLAAAGVMGLCMQRCSRSSSVVWRVGLAASSLLMCTVHYFGIISLGLMAAVFVVQNYRSRAGRWSDLLWIAPGPAALGLCVMLFYRGQRSALSISTWVPALSWTSLQQFAEEALPTWAIVIATLAWCGTWLLSRGPQPEALNSESDPIDIDSSVTMAPGEKHFLPAASGLVLMPVCLIVFSLILQPALISRYATVGTIGFAILMAALLRRCPTWITVTIGLWLFATGFLSLTDQYRYWQRMETRQAETIARLRQLAPDVPLIFESRHAMYPITRYASDLAPRIHFLALSDKNLQEFNSATPFRIVERDVALRIADFYPEYRTLPFDELKSLPRAYLFAFRQRKDFGKQLQSFEVTQRSPQLYELVPRPAANNPTTDVPRNASHEPGQPATVIE